MNALTSWTKVSASVEKPKSLGSWPMKIVMASPFMYPTWTSLLSRSAMNPSLPTPRPISMRPTMRASIPARAMAVAGSLATISGTMAAKISGETAESGPSTRIRDGPSRAYTTRQAMVV